MKICVVAFSVKGAMGQYLHCWLKALGNSAEVILFCPEHYSYEPEGYSIEKFPTSPSRWKAALRFLNLLKAREIANRVLCFCPDVVHLFNGEGYPWAWVLSRKLQKCRLPLVTTVHDVKAHSMDLYGLIGSLLRRGVIARSSLLHVHTRDSKRQIKRSLAFRRDISIIPHGNFGALFSEPGGKEHPLKETLLFFGRIAAYKGIDLFLEASQILGERFTYTIAGPGSFSKRERKLLKSMPLERYRIINRYIRDEEVAALFAQARVCVLPYRDSTQSSVPGISAKFGVPVAAAAVGGFIEDIPRVNGVLFKPNDSTALARGIIDALDKPVRYPKELDFENLVIQYLEMYRLAMESKNDTE